MKFWPIGKSSRDSYDIDRLVDYSLMERNLSRTSPQIICDIDKTYLETAFGSVIDLAKTALEAAKSKLTVKGAAETLMTLRWSSNPPLPLHFVSSSPPQLRRVLREKLIIDDLDWTSDTFKNQAYNLLKGRMDLLRHHVAYKVCAILSIIKQAGPNVNFIAIGDNAETDPFIYFGIAMKTLGLIDRRQFGDYLAISGIEPNVIDVILKKSDFEGGKITKIFIRILDGKVSADLAKLEKIIKPFFEFYEVCLQVGPLVELQAEPMWKLLKGFHNRYGITLGDLSTTLQKHWGISMRDRWDEFNEVYRESRRSQSVSGGEVNWSPVEIMEIGRALNPSREK